MAIEKVGFCYQSFYGAIWFKSLYNYIKCSSVDQKLLHYFLVVCFSCTGIAFPAKMRLIIFSCFCVAHRTDSRIVASLDHERVAFGILASESLTKSAVGVCAMTP